MKNSINALVQILDTTITVEGFSFSILALLLFLAFGTLVAWLIGGLFK